MQGGTKSWEGDWMGRTYRPNCFHCPGHSGEDFKRRVGGNAALLDSLPSFPGDGALETGLPGSISQGPSLSAPGGAWSAMSSGKRGGEETRASGLGKAQASRLREAGASKSHTPPLSRTYGSCLLPLVHASGSGQQAPCPFQGRKPWWLLPAHCTC